MDDVWKLLTEEGHKAGLQAAVWLPGQATIRIYGEKEQATLMVHEGQLTMTQKAKWRVVLFQRQSILASVATLTEQDPHAALTPEQWVMDRLLSDRKWSGGPSRWTMVADWGGLRLPSRPYTLRKLAVLWTLEKPDNVGDGYCVVGYPDKGNMTVVEAIACAEHTLAHVLHDEYPQHVYLTPKSRRTP